MLDSSKSHNPAAEMEKNMSVFQKGVGSQEAPFLSAIHQF
jgi:hypothetical protein